MLSANKGRDTKKKRQLRKSTNKPWFNSDCAVKRKEFYLAKNNFKNYENASNKETMTQKSKKYRLSMKSAYRDYHNTIHMNLRSLKSNDPKEYWNIINKAQSSGHKMGNITIESFTDHFRGLNENNPINLTPRSDQHTPLSQQVPTDDDLLPINQPITEAEIRNTIKKLKNGKAGGIDQILNEFIKNSPPDMVKLIQSFFNLILETGIVPDSWTIGLIVPIFKNKGDIHDPDNYRGITLLSCMGKLFTMIINTRLHRYLEDQMLLGEEQAGFREGYSTLDHIFSLHCIIDLFLEKKKRLFCAFVDYRKAFDMIDRTSLWQKLLKLNIKGKVLSVIKNAYKGAKSCVKLSTNMSEYFRCDMGVRQGENLSPLLFAIYLNDLEAYFETKCQGIALTEDGDENVLLRLFTLLYADDTILLSESAADLQSMVDILHNYCQQWHLTVNIDKTKVVVFSRGKIRNLPLITYGDKTIEVVYSYNYLGVLFNYNGKFGKTIKKQITQAKRAMFALLSKGRKLQLPIDILCHLFDACIVPILLYGCEVWGFSNTSDIERVHNYFCKYILHLNPKIPGNVARGELGRSRLECTIKQRMVNFWARLITGKSSKISSILFHILKNKSDSGSTILPWLTKITSTINGCGLGYILDTPPEHLNPPLVKAIVKDRVCAMESQDWHASILDSGYCSTYRTFKSSLDFEKYLTILSSKEAINLCRFRCGNHSLPIVTGRHHGVEKCNRKCNECDMNTIGDESHYIFTCPSLTQERSTYIEAVHLRPSNNQDMERLFAKQDHQTLSNLSKFCCIIMGKFKRRKNSESRKRKRSQKKKEVKERAQTKGDKVKNIVLLTKMRKTRKLEKLKERKAKSKGQME